MATAKSILRAGHGRPSRQNSLYEQTSTSNEVVAGLIGVKGTADYDMKLYTAKGIASCVFDYNISQPVYVSGAWESKYARNDQSVHAIEPEELFIFEGLLDDGETAIKYKLATAEGGTGKLQVKGSTEVAVAIFMEGQAASGSDLDQEALFLGALGGLSPVCVRETATTPASSVFTLDHAPISIHAVWLKGGVSSQATGNALVGVAATTLSTNTYNWIPGEKTITVASTDSTTQLIIDYVYVPGNA